MARVYEAFFERGPDIRYSMRSFRRGRPFPTYAELMTAADTRGVAGSFLASEEAYRAVRDLEARNLVVPVVGDFSGTRALAGVGTFLRDHGLTVAVFYASNVEMYLFRGDGWKTFYQNLSSLPTDGRSALVRSVFPGFGPGYPGGRSGFRRRLRLSRQRAWRARHGRPRRALGGSDRTAARRRQARSRHRLRRPAGADEIAPAYSSSNLCRIFSGFLFTAFASSAHIPRPCVAMTTMLSRGWTMRSCT